MTEINKEDNGLAFDMSKCLRRTHATYLAWLIMSFMAPAYFSALRLI